MQPLVEPDEADDLSRARIDRCAIDGLVPGVVGWKEPARDQGCIEPQSRRVVVVTGLGAGAGAGRKSKKEKDATHCGE
jgi:hypothetical protein